MWREVCVCSRVVFLHHRSIEGKKVCPGYTTSELRYSVTLPEVTFSIFSLCRLHKTMSHFCSFLSDL